MHRMYADFSDEAYEDMKNGRAKSNNGFRKNNGSFHPDQPDYSEIEENPNDNNTSSTNAAGQIIAFTVAGGIAIGVIVSPHIKKFWYNTVVPGANKLFTKIAGRSKNKKAYLIENESVSTTNVACIKTKEGISAEQFSNSIDLAIEGFQKNMNSEEAQIHMLNIMKLAEMLAKEIRSLSGVVVKDQELSFEYLKWRNAFEKLTTQQVTDGLNYVLENNSSLFNREIFQDMAWIWGKDSIREGELMQIDKQQIKKALII